MYDPNNPNIKSRNTLQWGLYQRELFWKEHDGEVPPLSTEPGDLQDPANRALTIGGWYYASSTAGQSYTHLANRQAFDRHRVIIPRKLVDASKGDTETTVFGHKASAPIGFAPIGNQQDLPPRLAKLPLYMPHDDEGAASLLPRAADSGFSACILTVDTRQLAWRRCDAAGSDYCAFYRGISADPGLSDPVFQKRMEEAGGAMWTDGVWHERAWSWEKTPWLMETWKRHSGEKPFCLKGTAQACKSIVQSPA
ncbi:L-lactate dehydrogenase [Drepanopeziza brunnea f. sp. 'multigermtubi' MB_m1]|uniref:L-lactate dehydrogenase n=1 Tax=Marssonina brunnea f. sp. multigermtubi (strain MB_m1) TaxID=1072389 RepID=K1WY17_MARBU|nr:L-lactate dehydrogenase [Drepanopeziza brunnea f. sp. 'multigermtubi' MB_m1]EKD17921.1 L-lactate dehydrogenase [Drepanopeziza brunnea f. sp. 'multigermtubi' MB_m1]